MQPDNYLDKKVGDVIKEAAVILDESTTVAEAVRTMRDRDVSSILVAKKGNPVGIVTERDVLYRVVAESKGPFKITLKEVMSAPLITASESTALKKTISLMREKGFRRLPVMGKDGIILGILTLKSVVGNIPSKSVELAEVDIAPANRIVCPYCGSGFESKEDLSKHVDRLHIGSGLLEGDMRQL
ncbi:MAG: CBS domain-containing protein [Nitrososphaera sp.]|jgi:CBS domain-containing protein